MGTWSVVMSAVCGCTLLYANMHHDQGYYTLYYTFAENIRISMAKCLAEISACNGSVKLTNLLPSNHVSMLICCPWLRDGSVSKHLLICCKISLD